MHKYSTTCENVEINADPYNSATVALILVHAAGKRFKQSFCNKISCIRERKDTRHP